MDSFPDNIDFDSPIFIVGFPRSGTTLLQTMVSTQKNICSFPETHYFSSLDQHNRMSINETDVFFSDLENRIKIKIPILIKEKFSSISENDIISKKSLFEEIVKFSISLQLDIYKSNKIRWVEKSPEHIFHVSTIKEFYPNVKIINIVRYPLNAIYSWKKNWKDNHSIPSLAHRFKDGVEYFQKFSQSYPDNALTIKYEDLIKYPNKELSKISTFLNLEFSSSLLEKNMRSQAKRVIRPHEFWKEKNKSNKLITDKKDYEWPIRKTLIMQNILNKELSKYKYYIHYPLFQHMFNMLIFLKKLFRKTYLFIFFKDK